MLNTKLPPWIEADFDTVRRDNTPISRAYAEGIERARERLANLRASELKTYLYVWSHAITESADYCTASIANRADGIAAGRERDHRLLGSVSSGTRRRDTHEGLLWLGMVPHLLARSAGVCGSVASS